MFNASSTAVDDAATIIKPTNITGAGRWIRQFSNYANVAMWGAVGDGVANDQPAIQTAINYCSLSGIPNLYFNTGTYYLSTFAINQYELSNLQVGYLPTKNDVNLYGTGQTILSSTNTYASIYGNQSTILTLRESITSMNITGFTFLRDGYLCGNNLNSGISITSNSGGSTFGTLILTPTTRDTITISNNNFINCHRAINTGTTMLPGSGIKTLNINSNNFYYPKGCDSSSTGGGSQVLLFTPDIQNLNIVDNFAEGVTDPTNNPSPNQLPKDGFVYYTGINNYIARNTLARFWLETLAIEQQWGGIAVTNNTSAKLPPVNGTVSVPLQNTTTYSALSTTAAIQGIDVGSVVAVPYYGTYIINSFSSNNPLICNMTRVSGDAYGGPFNNNHTYSVGAPLSGVTVYPFSRSYKLGCSTKIVDNNFKMGLSISSKTATLISNNWLLSSVPWMKYSHDPAVRADMGQLYLSGNNIPVPSGLLMNASTPEPFTNWIVERNNFYYYNELPALWPNTTSIYVPTLASNGLSGGIIRDNNAYLWTDINGNTVTTVNSAFPEIYYNCDESLVPYSYEFYHNTIPPFTPVLYTGVNLHSGVGVPDMSTTVQVVTGNTFHCSIPLSANIIQLCNNNTAYDNVGGNTIVFT